MPIDVFLNSIKGRGPQRIEGTAVFLTSPGDNVPGGLLHHLKLNTVLHEQVILLTVITEEMPSVPAANRFEVTPLECGFYRLTVHYGFMQSPNIPVAIKLLRDRGLVPTPELDTVVYYADRVTLIPSAAAGGMPTWRKRLFAFMSHNSQRAVEYYRLPPGSSVELGIQVEL